MKTFLEWIALNESMSVYVADYNNHVIRIITSTPINSVGTVANNALLSIYPNPSTGTFVMNMPASVKDAQVTITDMTGKVVATKTVNGTVSGQRLNFSTLAQGNYVVTVSADGNKYSSKLVVEGK